MTKTQEYLELHSRFKERESIQAVETILQGQSSDLAGFERAQLGRCLFHGLAVNDS